MAKQAEIKKLIQETQDAIKAKMYGHGNLQKLSERMKISKYKIRQTINTDNPDLELLGKIEKALLKQKAVA